VDAPDDTEPRRLGTQGRGGPTSTARTNTGDITMERRKFLIGAGSLAAGSAAAIGTGAFTSVQADRDIAVDVADDSNAFLALAPSDDPNGQYVDDSEDTVTIDFTQNDEVDNSGINDRAYTIFESVLEVTNQGTQSVKVGVNNIEAKEAKFQVFQSRKNLNYGNGSPSEGEQGLRLDGSANEADLPVISPGEGITIGFAFNLEKNEDFSDIDDTMTIVAGTQDDFPA